MICNANPRKKEKETKDCNLLGGLARVYHELREGKEREKERRKKKKEKKRGLRWKEWNCIKINKGCGRDSAGVVRETSCIVDKS